MRDGQVGRGVKAIFRTFVFVWPDLLPDDFEQLLTRIPIFHRKNGVPPCHAAILLPPPPSAVIRRHLNKRTTGVSPVSPVGA
jgi:hypothetical protein